MLTEKEFATISSADKDLLRGAIADATGEAPEKIGDGKILAMLAKLLPLLIQLAPLFIKKEEAEDVTRKIGDGTILNALLAALSNPQFIQTLAAIIALFKK